MLLKMTKGQARLYLKRRGFYCFIEGISEGTVNDKRVMYNYNTGVIMVNGIVIGHTNSLEDLDLLFRIMERVPR